MHALVKFRRLRVRIRMRLRRRARASACPDASYARACTHTCVHAYACESESFRGRVESGARVITRRSRDPGPAHRCMPRVPNEQARACMHARYDSIPMNSRSRSMFYVLGPENACAHACTGSDSRRQRLALWHGHDFKRLRCRPQRLRTLACSGRHPAAASTTAVTVAPAACLPTTPTCLPCGANQDLAPFILGWLAQAVRGRARGERAAGHVQRGARRAGGAPVGGSDDGRALARALAARVPGGSRNRQLRDADSLCTCGGSDRLTRAAAARRPSPPMPRPRCVAPHAHHDQCDHDDRRPSGKITR